MHRDWESLEIAPDRVRGRLGVSGPVHGAVYASLAESMAVRGSSDGERAPSAVAIHVSVMHPVLDATLEATARLLHRGRTTAVWEVEMVDSSGRVCALVRVTLGL